VTQTSKYVLPEGLPVPVPDPDGLSTPFWEGLARNQLWIQRCHHCKTWQWGPEWICHECHSFDIRWEQVDPTGRVYAIQRVWHPAHVALKGIGPYLTVLVELPLAGGVRMVGNVIGDPMRDIAPGAALQGVFEHHLDANPPFSLLQWKVCEES